MTIPAPRVLSTLVAIGLLIASAVPASSHATSTPGDSGPKSLEAVSAQVWHSDQPTRSERKHAQRIRRIGKTTANFTHTFFAWNDRGQLRLVVVTVGKPKPKLRRAIKNVRQRTGLTIRANTRAKATRIEFATARRVVRRDPRIESAGVEKRGKFLGVWPTDVAEASLTALSRRELRETLGVDLPVRIHAFIEAD